MHAGAHSSEASGPTTPLRLSCPGHPQPPTCRSKRSHLGAAPGTGQPALFLPGAFTSTPRPLGFIVPLWLLWLGLPGWFSLLLRTSGVEAGGSGLTSLLRPSKFPQGSHLPHSCQLHLQAMPDPTPEPAPRQYLHGVLNGHLRCHVSRAEFSTSLTSTVDLEAQEANLGTSCASSFLTPASVPASNPPVSTFLSVGSFQTPHSSHLPSQPVASCQTHRKSGALWAPETRPRLPLHPHLPPHSPSQHGSHADLLVTPQVPSGREPRYLVPAVPSLPSVGPTPFPQASAQCLLFRGFPRAGAGTAHLSTATTLSSLTSLRLSPYSTDSIRLCTEVFMVLLSVNSTERGLSVSFTANLQSPAPCLAHSECRMNE